MDHQRRMGLAGPWAALLLALGLGACAEQPVPMSTSMQLGAATLAPRGYIQFCQRRPDQCGLRAPLTEIKDEALQAALNREEWSNVLSVGHPGPPVAPSAAGVAERPLRLMMASYTPTFGDDYRPAPLLVASPRSLLTIAPDAEVLEPGLADKAPAAAPVPRLDDLFQDVRRAAAAALHYTPALWSHLEVVNAEINARIKPRTDMEAFGVNDYWTLPLEGDGRGEGNCKHYALEKRRVLTEAGMSEDALSLAIVRTPQGETHAVLIVATDRGDYVLDNLTPDIRGWRQAGYTWLSRQTPGSPLRWAAVATSLRAGG
jgi:predicted transglutaminase-like cysteine proteinase